MLGQDAIATYCNTLHVLEQCAFAHELQLKQASAEPGLQSSGHGLNALDLSRSVDDMEEFNVYHNLLLPYLTEALKEIRSGLATTEDLKLGFEYLEGLTVALDAAADWDLVNSLPEALQSIVQSLAMTWTAVMRYLKHDGTLHLVRFTQANQFLINFHERLVTVGIFDLKPVLTYMDNVSASVEVSRLLA